MKNSARKKLYIIVGINLESKAFGNIYGIRVIAKFGSMTHQTKPLKKPKSMRKDRTALGRLGLMVRFNSIWLNGST